MNVGIKLVAPTQGVLQIARPEFQKSLHFITGGGRLVPVTVDRMASAPDYTCIAIPTSHSGRLCAPIALAPGACPTLLQTSTLAPRSRPYALSVELCRGRLFQLRECSAASLHEPVGDDRVGMANLCKIFRRLLFSHNEEERERLAHECLHSAESWEEAWIRNGIQSLVSPPQIGVLVEAGSAPALRSTHAATYCLAPSWQQAATGPTEYDWTHLDAWVKELSNRGHRLWMGPLIDFRRLPSWFQSHPFSEQEAAEIMCGWIHALISRYGALLNGCLVWTGVSSPPKAQGDWWTEQNRLRLCVRLLDAARKQAPALGMTLGVDFPWCDHLLREAKLLEFQLLDALGRANYGLSGIVLEIHLGWRTEQSFPRPPSEVLSVLADWAQLGLPLSLWFREKPLWGGHVQAGMMSPYVTRIWTEQGE